MWGVGGGGGGGVCPKRVLAASAGSLCTLVAEATNCCQDMEPHSTESHGNEEGGGGGGSYCFFWLHLLVRCTLM